MGPPKPEGSAIKRKLAAFEGVQQPAARQLRGRVLSAPEAVRLPLSDLPDDEMLSSEQVCVFVCVRVRARVRVRVCVCVCVRCRLHTAY